VSAAVDLATATAGWSPPAVSTAGTTTAWTVAAVSGLFDLDPVAGEGDPVPPMWHWFGFLDHPRHDELGEDGHPAAGHFLPPIPHRRRMIAGGRLEVRAPMRVGETLERRSALVRAEVKRGRSGEMLLVTVRHEFVRAGVPVVTEEQDVVYRSQPPGQARGLPTAEEPAADPAPSAEAVELTPDEALLFRFSALTYNTHRIHYDQPYVTAVEGYPGLVVHGPLQALMLLEMPRRHRADRDVTRCEYRLHRPAFVGRPLRADHVDAGAEGGARSALTVAAGIPGSPPSITATLTLAPQEDTR
jgi:3-methylfumaryl-CoA hydratase